MFRPYLLAWMVKSSDFSCQWVKPGEIVAFVDITLVARKAQIIVIIRATMLDRDDVIDMKWRRSADRSEVAVFTTVTGALHNRLPLRL
jgi:hypothetical protein